MSNVKTVAVVSGKGGVGKTTTIVSLAHSAAKRGLATLLIDFDNQANATASLMNIDDSLTLQNAYDLVATKNEITPVSIRDNLSLLPAANALTDLDKEDFEVYFTLRERIQDQFHDYNLVLIDTPGNLGQRVITALVASSAIFVPIELTDYAVQALVPLLDLIGKVKQRFNSELLNLGVLPNRVSGLSRGHPALPVISRERTVYHAIIARLGTDSILGLIGQRNVIKTSLANAEPVWEHGAANGAALATQELEGFAKNLFDEIGL